MSGDRATSAAPGDDGADLLTGERDHPAEPSSNPGADGPGAGGFDPDGLEAAGASPFRRGTRPRPASAWQQRLARLGYRAPDTRPLRERLVPPMPDGKGISTGEPSPVLERFGIHVPAGLWFWLCRWSGWLGPLAVTLFGAILVFTHLGTPHDIIFDETYYAKDSWAIWHYGFEVNWPDTTNAAILANPHHIPAPTGPAFIAHPPAGKWVIGLGEMVFGLTPFGWRFMVALLGSLAVLMVCRIGRRMFRSTLIGCVAGLLMCVDGLHFVMSRTGLLDLVVMFWALAAFGLLVLDRDRARARLADAIGATVDNPDPAPDHELASRAWLGWRPLRLLAGICLGICCATKWNGLDFLAVFGLLTVFWDAGARKTAGARHPYLTAVLKDGIWAVFCIVVVGFLTYLASWSGWLFSNATVGGTTGAYDRHWADNRAGLSPDSWTTVGLHHLPQVSMTWVPARLRSLWHYHAEIWHFNTTLTSPHIYQSNPWSWLVTARPVSFYYPGGLKPSQCGGAAQCSSEVLALGTPLLWWAACFAVLYALYRWIFARDWRAAAICCGIAAGYVPWFQWQQRTIFYFYSIDFEPYLCLALALMIGSILGKATASRDRRLFGAIGAGVLVVAIMATFLYFLPIYDAQITTYQQWNDRMWWSTWI
ncbi:dolichyl-phosphate-mannose--protein mannosyltransferase [Streptacidiphilus cavernicola]|uniref:Polyprenol-phosphate-mannose--protein mannosyltransferase n=1 Tax=Streptacidiphilus cavernicola TaxID=3342716 RepID=A0ABV6VN66_9ACTN